ncbi:MAG: hypothetical protein ACRDZ3_15405 [Acidimicrobiia bacterium]
MKPESYFTWEATSHTVADAEWRAPVLIAPRRRGVAGALSALAALLRSDAA